MKVTQLGTDTAISANESDTYDFANYNPAGRWPGSALSGEKVWIRLDEKGDLIEYEGPEDCLSEELGAFIEYALAK